MKHLTRMVLVSAVMLCWFAVGLNSCSNPTDGDGDDAPFYFRVSVADTAGNPVPGLTVGVWSDVALRTGTSLGATSGTAVWLQEWTLHQNAPNPFFPTTTIAWDTPCDCIPELTVSDLSGALVRELCNPDSIVTAGSYAVNFTLDCADCCGGTSVFACELVARDTTASTVLFERSIYVVAHTSDVACAALGLTGADGVFETDRRLPFPCLFELPTMIATYPAHEDSFTFFDIPDDVVIGLLDTDGVRTTEETYHRTIQDGPNSFHLVWHGGRH